MDGFSTGSRARSFSPSHTSHFQRNSNPNQQVFGTNGFTIARSPKCRYYPTSKHPQKPAQNDIFARAINGHTNARRHGQGRQTWSWSYIWFYLLFDLSSSASCCCFRRTATVCVRRERKKNRPRRVGSRANCVHKKRIQKKRTVYVPPFSPAIIEGDIKLAWNRNMLPNVLSAKINHLHANGCDSLFSRSFFGTDVHPGNGLRPRC